MEIPEAIRRQSEAMVNGQRFMFGSGDRRAANGERDDLSACNPGGMDPESLYELAQQLYLAEDFDELERCIELARPHRDDPQVAEAFDDAEARRNRMPESLNDSVKFALGRVDRALGRNSVTGTEKERTVAILREMVSQNADRPPDPDAIHAHLIALGKSEKQAKAVRSKYETILDGGEFRDTRGRPI